MPARPAVVWRQPKVLAAPGLQPGLPAALSSQCEAFDAGPVTVVPQNFQDDNGVRHAQMLLSTTTAPTLALNILWFCDTDHANCNTGSVAHDFQQLPVTKDTVAEKNFALRCSEQTPWRSYGKETTQTGTLRPEETHSKLNSFDTRGSKAPQWLERILPSTGQKRQSGESTAKISRQQGTLRHRLSDRLWLSEKLTHRRPRFSATLLENEPVPRS